MIKDYHNTSNQVLSKIISANEVLKLALESLERKKGIRYSLIKDYILNYEKIDKNINSKIKKIIIFIYEYSKTDSEHQISKRLNYCFKKLCTPKNQKNIFCKLYSICIVYSEQQIIDAYIKNDY